MIFTETKLKGAYTIDIEKREDERGFFARSWAYDEYEAHGLIPRIVQSNISYNKMKGTLRGMHYQIAPYQEAKIVRCTRGALYDVIVDLRRSSPTYKEWVGVELTAGNYRMLYVPEGFAHGFLTLEDNTEAIYHVTQVYSPQAERGARYNDPAFNITWPGEIVVISDKDRNWPEHSQPAGD